MQRLVLDWQAVVRLGLGMATGIFVLAAAGPAAAHVAQQGFVLLLPTGLYITAGVAAVALTVVLLALLPADLSHRLFAPLALLRATGGRIADATSLAMLALLVGLIVLGLAGSRDPLANPLPLAIWTLFWIAFVSLQGGLGDLWRWFGPWHGIARLAAFLLRRPPPLRLPGSWSGWPGLLVFQAFGLFFLVDLAPDDPDRLALVVAGYALFTLAGMALFGVRDWLARVECFSMLLALYAAIAPFGRRGDRLAVGLPGWQIVRAAPLAPSASLLVLFLLGTGTFDGLNETFWWLARIGINPLAFPGRSAVVWPTAIGLIATNLLVVAAFAGAVRAGLALAGAPDRFPEAFGRLAAAVLPIALAYHAAHFLTAFLVDGQYALLAFSDPLGRGADLLGLGDFRVTTGFFNSRDTVQAIWLTQAGLIVAGHILSILASHAIAVDLFADARRALVSQVPLAAFMIAYTLFGLTLLAAPRGA